MSNILIITGHPNPNSYCAVLSNAYAKGVNGKANLKEIDLSTIQFDPVLRSGYSKRMELEPDLQESWDKIQWADHIIIVTPIWWGGMPAVLKGFFDRLFLPGMAFKYRENSVWWDKLLVGKTAHIIVTMDTPVWFYKLFYSNAGIKQLKNNILSFCGVKTKAITYITPIRNSNEEFRKKWLSKIERLGSELK